MSTHQRLRRGTRSVRSAKVLMPAWRSTAATRGASQRSTQSPIRGTGTAALRSCSIAAAMARAAAGPLRAGPVKSLARSSRWRDLAKAAISRRMAPMTPRDDWPASRASPRYRATASLDDSPSCQARSAASEAASGSDSGGAVTDKAISTHLSLRCWHCYAAKVSYRHRSDKRPRVSDLHRRVRAWAALGQHERESLRPSPLVVVSCLCLPYLLGCPDLLIVPL